ncbi:hypothetical protein KPL39_02060 [Clostridium gasigenes]|uniref:hypothetical protein n=1 Tax=Clostridium gasigenes TaxID=94869 RepID=UPI001C0BE63E|nr:hypothetical protein [Clostridium gasigenes]MBU3135045.1 hypothetical protein [Clostridium gasigenes]
MILGFKTKNDKKREKALKDILKNLESMQEMLREFKMDMLVEDINRYSENIDKCCKRLDEVREEGVTDVIK